MADNNKLISEGFGNEASHHQNSHDESNSGGVVTECDFKIVDRTEASGAGANDDCSTFLDTQSESSSHSSSIRILEEIDATNPASPTSITSESENSVIVVSGDDEPYGTDEGELSINSGLSYLRELNDFIHKESTPLPSRVSTSIRTKDVKGVIGNAHRQEFFFLDSDSENTFQNTCEDDTLVDEEVTFIKHVVSPLSDLLSGNKVSHSAKRKSMDKEQDSGKHLLDVESYYANDGGPPLKRRKPENGADVSNTEIKTESSVCDVSSSVTHSKYLFNSTNTLEGSLLINDTKAIDSSEKGMYLNRSDDKVMDDSEPSINQSEISSSKLEVDPDDSWNRNETAVKSTYDKNLGGEMHVYKRDGSWPKVETGNTTSCSGRDVHKSCDNLCTPTSSQKKESVVKESEGGCVSYNRQITVDSPSENVSFLKLGALNAPCYEDVVGKCMPTVLFGENCENGASHIPQTEEGDTGKVVTNADNPQIEKGGTGEVETETHLCVENVSTASSGIHIGDEVNLIRNSGKYCSVKGKENCEVAKKLIGESVVAHKNRCGDNNAGGDSAVLVTVKGFGQESRREAGKFCSQNDVGNGKMASRMDKSGISKPGEETAIVNRKDIGNDSSSVIKDKLSIGSSSGIDVNCDKGISAGIDASEDHGVDGNNDKIIYAGMTKVDISADHSKVSLKDTVKKVEVGSGSLSEHLNEKDVSRMDISVNTSLSSEYEFIVIDDADVHENENFSKNVVCSFGHGKLVNVKSNESKSKEPSQAELDVSNNDSFNVMDGSDIVVVDECPGNETQQSSSINNISSVSDHPGNSSATVILSQQLSMENDSCEVEIVAEIEKTSAKCADASVPSTSFDRLVMGEKLDNVPPLGDGKAKAKEKGKSRSHPAVDFLKRLESGSSLSASHQPSPATSENSSVSSDVQIVDDVANPAEPFRSDDPAENADNDDPGWEHVRRLETDEERYRQVRACWFSRKIPNPNKDLTYQSYRKSRLAREESSSVTEPITRGHKRAATSQPGQRETKRVRTQSMPCTAVIDSKISDAEQKFVERTADANERFRRKKEVLTSQFYIARRLVQCNMRSQFFRNKVISDVINICGETNLIQHLMVTEKFEENTLFSDLANRLTDIQNENESEVSKLRKARDEIYQFCSFYKGLAGVQDPTEISNEEVQELREIDAMYEAYIKCYTDTV